MVQYRISEQDVLNKPTECIEQTYQTIDTLHNSSIIIQCIIAQGQ